MRHDAFEFVDSQSPNFAHGQVELQPLKQNEKRKGGKRKKKKREKGMGRRK